MFDICNKPEVSANDYDCEECLRCDDSGKAHCCMNDCGDNFCEKACAKVCKFKEMEQWDSEKLFESLQNWILSHSESMPFSFDILQSRFVPSKKEVDMNG
ncbi:hypothetical protein [Sporomusa malonica]|uniref:Uncharacterized protein n=1 Tax=Sporomusa malonica TaxID=112901 RepID=A0A1W2ATU7_9FIRM|nr:hypothetical protein [Sporomusa malonica]SMC63930.1 hypothetical protein SAMN04488500_106100 [Sporomusa malonica]